MESHICSCNYEPAHTVPFRNLKLTHLLQDSLSGDSKTLMFVQISTNENDLGKTLCSLNFASRVSGIELGQAWKQVDVGELSRYKLMVCYSEKGQQGFTKILYLGNDFKLPIPRNSERGNKVALYSYAGNQTYIEDV